MSETTADGSNGNAGHGRGVCRDPLPLDALLESPPKDRVNLAHRRRRQRASVDATSRAQHGVEVIDLRRLETSNFDSAQDGENVVIDVSLVTPNGGGREFWLRHFEPPKHQ